jgi:hypothetical protein
MRELVWFSKNKIKIKSIIMTSSHSCKNLKLILTLVLTCEGVNQFSLWDFIVRIESRTGWAFKNRLTLEMTFVHGVGARMNGPMTYKKLLFLLQDVFYCVRVNYQGFPLILWTFFPFHLNPIERSCFKHMCTINDSIFFT